MSIKVLVNSPPKNRVSINNQQRETIRSVGILPVAPPSNYLSGLLDVDATHPANNYTLVYNEATGKYVVEELPLVNGGTF
mgnify:CR=1 FL=1